MAWKHPAGNFRRKTIAEPGCLHDRFRKTAGEQLGESSLKNSQLIHSGTRPVRKAPTQDMIQRNGKPLRHALLESDYAMEP